MPRQLIGPHPSQGAGSLPMVMILLMAAALLMLHSHRALIAEQRSVAHQVRATWAIEAAEAGRAWALAALNRGGAIDASCRAAPPGNAASQAGLRERLLSSDPISGRLFARNDRGAACWLGGNTAQSPGAWRCACPDSGLPQLGSSPDGDNHPAFRVRLEPGPSTDSATGVLRLVVTGCSHMSDPCDGQSAGGAPPGGDATAEVRSLLAPLGQLLRAPAAPITALGPVRLGAGVTLVNGDATSGGSTVQAAGAISIDPGARLLGPPGRLGPSTLMADDAQLALTAEALWRRHFGVAPATLRDLPTLHRISCPAPACGAAEVQAALDAGHRAIWLQGDWQLDTPIAWPPAELGRLIMVDGATRWQGPQEVDALVVSHAFRWQHPGGGVARLRGALISLGEVWLDGPVDLVRDTALLARLSGSLGVFAPVPGSWQDFVNR